MEQFVSIKEEPFSQDEDNTKCFLEIIITNSHQLDPIARAKIQFQFSDDNLFQTDHQTCLLCDEAYEATPNMPDKHITRHTETPFTCDLLDFRSFVKDSLKVYQEQIEFCEQIKPDLCEINNIFTASCCNIEPNEVNDPISTCVNEDVLLEASAKEKKHPCEVCGHKAGSRSALAAHLRTHTGEKPFHCNMCDFKTSHLPALKNHKKLLHAADKNDPIQSSSQEHICQTCGYVAKSPTVLKCHMHVHQEDKQFSCDICDFKSVRQVSLIKHKALHNETLQVTPPDSVELRNICNICGYVAKTQGRLKVHFRSHTGEKPFNCDLCDFKTSRQGSLRTHKLSIHGKQRIFSCETCNFMTDSGRELHTHVKIHKTDHRFQCDICGVRLTTKESLETHFRIHTGEKPYHCDVCDYKCSAKSGMNAHKKIHSEHKPFLCDKCDYKTFRLQRLKIHMMVHTGEKSFKCSMCDYKCPEKTRIKRHMRIHTGEKPYSCEYCDYKSSIKGNLNTHIRGVHRKKNENQCAKCEFTCLLKRQLREHVMTFHAEAEAQLNLEQDEGINS